MNEWNRAIGNFLTYLPKHLTDWILVFDRRFHSRIVAELAKRLTNVNLLEINEAMPNEVRRLGKLKRTDDQAGFLDFGMRYTEFEYDEEHPVYALDVFVSWPPSRVRMCLDVSDLNFCDLFSESPSSVAKRCIDLRDRLDQGSTLFYLDRKDKRSPLRIDCTGSRWTAYSGVEEFDYLLPSGEVACLPKSVDGALRVHGWVIGTIPFGWKYGHIQRGDLSLRFERRRVVRIGGNNRKLCADMEVTLNRVPRLQFVSELGIGQSRAVTKAAEKHVVGYRWHERHFGVHLGLGAELPESLEPGVSRSAGHHLDIVLGSGSLANSSSTREILHW
jgi:hypothetical protein